MARKSKIALNKNGQKIIRTEEQLQLVAAGEVFEFHNIRYVMNADGTYFRDKGRDNQATQEEVLFALKNIRAIDFEELAEQIGKTSAEYMMKVGYLRPDAKIRSLLWITKKAASHFGLARPVVCGVTCDFPAG